MKDMLGRSRTILDDLYFDRNSCSRYLEQSASALRFLTDCGSGRVEATYSSQNEMICDELASIVLPGFCSRAQTHIICEPVVLEGLHVFSCHCMPVSRHESCAWEILSSYSEHHGLKTSRSFSLVYPSTIDNFVALDLQLRKASSGFNCTGQRLVLAKGFQ